MNFLKALVMGLVHGLTEFLPVSSTGHFAIGRQLLHLPDDMSGLLVILFHFSSLFAICYVFRKDLVRMLKESVRMIRDLIYNGLIYIHNRSYSMEEQEYKKILHNNYRKMVAMILISSIPTFTLGVILDWMIRDHRYSLLVCGLGLLITTVMLLVVHHWKSGNKIPKDITRKEAVIVGCCQGMSAISGISRTGITLTSGLLCGFQKKFAVMYSFFVCIPVLIVRIIMDIRAFSFAGMAFSTVFFCFCGMILAGAVGIIAIKLMLKLIYKRCFGLFATYCFAAGVFAIVCNYI